MNHREVSIQHINETSLLIKVSDEIDITLAPLLAEVCRAIQQRFPEVIELTPSYTTILIEYGNSHTNMNYFCQQVHGLVTEIIQNTQESDTLCGKIIDLPVYYDLSTGADLNTVANSCKLSIQEVIAIHSGRDYTVCAIGFSPGFAFLAELDDRLAIPRKSSPRACVPTGSVAIAERQTAVYPVNSPGGWNLLGKCPLPLFDIHKTPMSPFTVGDRVRFSPINRDTFIKLGGIL